MIIQPTKNLLAQTSVPQIYLNDILGQTTIKALLSLIYLIRHQTKTNLPSPHILYSINIQCHSNYFFKCFWLIC